ncbi:MAG: hypothetical protein OSA51_00085 [Octadecabacter sp.]|nr:hypothetical protein [Octadecabacter sp.]
MATSSDETGVELEFIEIKLPRIKQRRKAGTKAIQQMFMPRSRRLDIEARLNLRSNKFSMSRTI